MAHLLTYMLYSLSTVNEGPTEGLWALFHHLHRQPPDTPWPSVLHCHEGELQSRMLRNYTKQLWRTVWHERSSRVLNDGLCSNMAISFTLTKPPAPTDTDSKDDDGRHKKL